MTDMTIQAWESALGREGVWCRSCQRSTPVHQLTEDPITGAQLRCESCAGALTLVLPTPRQG